MLELAERINEQLPFLSYGLVNERREDGWIVSTQSHMYSAQKAAGCLLLPEPGDVVLLSLDDEGVCFVLSVLERGGEKPVKNRIAIDGSTDLHVQHGDLSITSDRDINLASDKNITCITDRITIQAQKGRAVLKHMTVLGQVLINQAQKIKSIAGSAEYMYKRLTQRLGNSYRYVAEHDEIQSNTTRRVVEDLMTVQTGNTCHLAEETIKIDAEHINLG